MRLRVLLAAPLLALVPSLVCACSERAEDSPSWDAALRRLDQLPEVAAWARYVSQTPGVKAVLSPAVDKQSLITGRCYWSVTLYSDEGTHLHRWNTFYVSVDGDEILVDDVTGGEPVSLASWRKAREPGTEQPGR